MRVGVVAIVAAAAIGLLTAPAANAAFGLTGLSATPADTNAGANSDFSISLDVVDPSADLKDLTIHLPPGLVGNPLAAPTCTEEQLNANACPAASDVGDVTNDVTLNVFGFLPVDQTVNGNLFNVIPRTGEPARFGIILNALPFNVPILGPAVLPPIILQSAARLRPSDFGLDTVLADLPNTATVGGMPTAIDIRGVSLTLSGQVGTPPQGFLRNPTSCGTHTVGFDADSYDGQTATGQTTFDTVNCGAEPFSPELSASVKVGKSTDAVELSTTIAQTIDEAGLQRAQVILPKDLFGNATALAISCPDADFQAGNCPANTVVGTALAGSPLLAQPLTGPVSLVTSAAGLPDLGLDLRGALALKLKGTIGVTPEVRNIVTFDGLPDIPIANFTLTFAGGPNGLNTATRDLCQPPEIVFDADFTSFSGAAVHQSVPATVDCSGATGGGGGGGGGGSHNRKPPKAKIFLQKGEKHPQMSLVVKKGSETLRSVKLTLPKQLRFGSEREFNHGAAVTAGGKIKAKHTRSTLSLRAKKPINKFIAKFAGKSLEAKGLHGDTRPRFKLKVVDKTGKRTKLTVRPK